MFSVFPLLLLPVMKQLQHTAAARRVQTGSKAEAPGRGPHRLAIDGGAAPTVHTHTHTPGNTRTHTHTHLETHAHTHTWKHTHTHKIGRAHV